MLQYLKRLAKTAVAYQIAAVISKPIALLLLPIYTRHIPPSGYGTAELLLTVVILTSIVVRFGIHEAFVRFHFHDEFSDQRQRLARTATAFLLLTTTVTALAVTVAAEPLSELILGESDPALLQITALGLWAFTNLELAYALLRVEERTRPYLIASLSNIALTVGLTVWLVVFRDEGARGLLAGNFIASTVVLLGLWLLLRDRLIARPSRTMLTGMLRFGLPTVPAEMSVFALNFIDRLYLYRVQTAAAAGLYSLAVKLAAVVVIAVRAFQYAWPPLAYSIVSDREAGRIYARITTYYVLFCGLVVSALTLFSHWVLRIFAAPAYAEAQEALPWVALGWMLYGLFLVLVVTAGRANVTTRNAPAALIGLVANVVLLVALVPPLGIAGAGIALCGAYVVMLAAMFWLTRNLFPVQFEWRRLLKLVVVIGGMTVGGELLLPTSGLDGLSTRFVLLAATPFVLLVTRFARRDELAGVRLVTTRFRGRGG